MEKIYLSFVKRWQLLPTEEGFLLNNLAFV